MKPPGVERLVERVAEALYDQYRVDRPSLHGTAWGDLKPHTQAAFRRKAREAVDPPEDQ